MFDIPFVNLPLQGPQPNVPLSYRHLEGNLLASLNGIDLSHNSHLVYVNLGANGIKDIPDDFFLGTAVQTLYLDSNKIVAITNRTLAGLGGILKTL